MVVLSAKLSSLRLRHLRLIDALARSRNLHRVAEELNITQPAASKILQELERILDVALFERQSRGVAPTKIGETVIAYAKRAISDAERLSAELASLKRGGYGMLTIGAILSTASGLLPAALGELKRDRPLTTVRLITGTSDRLLEALERNELELVIGRLAEPRHLAMFEIAPIGREEIWFFVDRRHPLASMVTVELADLQDYAFALLFEATPMRHLVESTLGAAGLPSWGNLVETTSIFAVLSLVREAQMVSVLPSSIIREQVERGDFVRLPIQVENSLTPYGVVTRKGVALSTNAADFVAIVTRLVRDGLLL